MSAHDIWTLELAAIVSLFATCAVFGIRALYRHCGAVVEEHVRAALDDQAADFGEPTREQVEADVDAAWIFGPQVAYGIADAEADAQWADVLAPFNLTPVDVRSLHNAHRLRERTDRIRDQINENEVDRFRREINEWDRGASA